MVRVARDIAREGDASPTGVYKQKFHVFKAKMTLFDTLSQIFQAGMPQYPLSMTRGLQRNFLSFSGKIAQKITILGPLFQNFLGDMSPEPLYDSGFTNKSV